MADILIRGMEKPGSCRECDFCELQDINFEILYFCNRNDRFLDDEEVCNIPNDCPIIELPEHGDLIDRVAFRAEMDKHYPFDHGTQRRHGEADKAKSTVINMLANAPVIVPSNKEETE